MEGFRPRSSPMAEEACVSPNGGRLAYMPLARAFRTWKRYRGGRTTAIWIADLADSRIEKVPRENSNDFAPMWVGDQVYFLSDRNGPVTLFWHDTGARKVAQVFPTTVWTLSQLQRALESSSTSRSAPSTSTI